MKEAAEHIDDLASKLYRCMHAEVVVEVQWEQSATARQVLANEPASQG